ncbi:hypothetical protein WR25_24553 [Diploscapter pachys]|uniref:GDP-D-glucose phosphorylase 1 n=1 Tax=Diploscapter pachys TaxID=2018661 RepID=A0A2A2JPB6_9BILA|nr:hypothetical protein WR25_24553 [Diploscapter pachys]
MRFRNIKEPFNSIRFNFTKLHDNEVMMYLKCEDNPITTDPLDRHLIAVNASPLERDHCLIIPAVNKCHPQVLNPVAIRLAVDIMLLVTDSDFHILFNSLLGQASVNHLHLHALYWPYDSDLINRCFEHLADVPDVYVIQPPMWLTSAFAFQLTKMEDYEKFKSNIFKCVNFLTDQNQAHNLFFTRAQPIRTDGPDRVEDRRRQLPLYVTCYVFPRQNIVGAKPPSNFNPAANELAGCLTSYTYRFFESAAEQAVVRIIEEEALLPTNVFQNLCCDLSDLYSNRPLGTSRESKTSLLDGLSSPEIDELRDTFESFNQPRSPSVRLKNPLNHTQSVDEQVVRFEIHSAD